MASVQKSEEEWRAILSPEQFQILRRKGTDVNIAVCLSHPDALPSQVVALVVELRFINLSPNLTPAVAGQHSMKVFQEP
ncbi:hypothetical protein ACLOJK_018621 [Asimina triloba]